jgi:hypothetical protein
MSEGNMSRNHLQRNFTGFPAVAHLPNNNIPFDCQQGFIRPSIHSADYNMGVFISALRTSAIIASTIIVIVALLTITWIVGVKLAEPFGIIWYNSFTSTGAPDDQEASNAQQEKVDKASQHEHRKTVERRLSGFIAMCFAFCTVTFEHALAQENIWWPGNLWVSQCVPVLKGIIEAWVTLGMLRLALAAVRRMVSN